MKFVTSEITIVALIVFTVFVTDFVWPYIKALTL